MQRCFVGAALAVMWAGAADAVERTSATIRDSVDRLATISTEQTAANKPPGFSEWSAKLDAAKDRRKSGKRVFWIGLGVGAIVPIVAAAAISTDPLDTNTGNAATALYVAGTVVGGAMAIVGGIKWYNASEDIDDLDREGRIKGYLTLGPAPDGKGAQVALTLRF